MMPARVVALVEAPNQALLTELRVMGLEYRNGSRLTVVKLREDGIPRAETHPQLSQKLPDMSTGRRLKKDYPLPKSLREHDYFRLQVDECGRKGSFVQVVTSYLGAALTPYFEAGQVTEPDWHVKAGISNDSLVIVRQDLSDSDRVRIIRATLEHCGDSVVVTYDCLFSGPRHQLELAFENDAELAGWQPSLLALDKRIKCDGCAGAHYYRSR